MGAWRLSQHALAGKHHRVPVSEQFYIILNRIKNNILISIIETSGVMVLQM